MIAAPPLAFRTVEAGGAREWLTGRPTPGAPALLVLQPLFAEMNRCRMLVADLMVALAAAGWCPWTLDLPGLGESETPLEEVAFADWRRATAAAAEQTGAVATIALRGGALVEPTLARRWRFQPANGEALLRDLVRARLASEAEPRLNPVTLHGHLAAGMVELGGYRLGPALSQLLRTAVADGAARTVMLAGAAEAGAAQVDGPALWRAAEPARAPALATALAEDILAWLASC